MVYSTIRGLNKNALKPQLTQSQLHYYIKYANILGHIYSYWKDVGIRKKNNCNYMVCGYFAVHHPPSRNSGCGLDDGCFSCFWIGHQSLGYLKAELMMLVHSDLLSVLGSFWQISVWSPSKGRHVQNVCTDHLHLSYISYKSMTDSSLATDMVFLLLRCYEYPWFPWEFWHYTLDGSCWCPPSEQSGICGVTSHIFPSHWDKHHHQHWWGFLGSTGTAPVHCGSLPGHWLLPAWHCVPHTLTHHLLLTCHVSFQNSGVTNPVLLSGGKYQLMQCCHGIDLHNSLRIPGQFLCHISHSVICVLWCGRLRRQLRHASNHQRWRRSFPS